MMAEKEDDATYKVGEFIVLTSGDYSDFGNLGWFRTMKEFTKGSAIADYRQEHPFKGEYRESEYEFAAWLTTQGYLVEEMSNASEWHVGSYGTLFDHRS